MEVEISNVPEISGLVTFKLKLFAIVGINKDGIIKIIDINGIRVLMRKWAVSEEFWDGSLFCC